jgi:hypothetical protein
MGVDRWKRLFRDGQGVTHDVCDDEHADNSAEKLFELHQHVSMVSRHTR